MRFWFSPHPALESIGTKLELLESAIRAAPEDTGPEIARLALQETVRDMQLDVVAHTKDLEELEAKFADLVLAVAEGIERTDRAERRIRDTVKRARKELREAGLENPGMEAESDQLRLVDGDGGDVGGLRPVPAEVAPTEPEASSIKGVPLAALIRARGY